MHETKSKASESMCEMECLTWVKQASTRKYIPKKKKKIQRKRAPKGRSQVWMCEMKLVEWEWKSAHKKGFETWPAILSEKNQDFQ